MQLEQAQPTINLDPNLTPTESNLQPAEVPHWQQTWLNTQTPPFPFPPQIPQSNPTPRVSYLQPPPMRATNFTVALNSYTQNTLPNIVPVTRKRTGSPVYSRKAKLPRNSPRKRIDIYTCNFPIIGVPEKPNCNLYQNEFNTLSSIRTQILSRMCSRDQCRLIIFIGDFLLNFYASPEQVIREIIDLIQYVESRGHLITFAYLAYVPSYSRDPKAIKDHFTPRPDYTNYITIINNRLQRIAQQNPVRACFYNKHVGYNSRKDAYMPTDWERHSSTAESHLSYAQCLELTSAALIYRSHQFYLHVDLFINAVK